MVRTWDEKIKKNEMDGVCSTDGNENEAIGKPQA
jgi:hypothetical protein